ncbi:MAG: hypothetical protein QG622_645 [Actinomycetota bacterium]|nr:hypothetical protein [Actinomycetota bacterium]
MEPAVSGPSAGFVLMSVMWAEVRHLLAVLLWVLVITFATAAGAWCCGFAVREAWLRAGPPAREPRPRARTAADAGATSGDDEQVIDLIAREAADGIAEIEKYLAEAGAGGRTSRPDRRERDTDT